MMPFSKDAHSIDQHITLLKDRGLNIRDEGRVKCYLEVVSYFRLTSYMRPFQIWQDDKHRFKAGTEFKSIVNLYAFDRELRLLIMDAIERVEVAVRSVLNNHMSTKYQTDQDNSGSHWYLNELLFKREYQHKRMLSEIESKQTKAQQELTRDIQKINKSSAAQEIKDAHIYSRTRENYVRYYQSTYAAPRLIPSWAAMEELTFGAISHMYQGLAKDSDRKAIAKRFFVPYEIFQSWLHTLNFVRNCCAHHSRLWNRELAIAPKTPNTADFVLPDHLPDTNIQPNRRIYVVLLLLAYLMQRISPDSQWSNKVKALLTVMYPDTPHAPMGFPTNWQTHPFWGGES